MSAADYPVLDKAGNTIIPYRTGQAGGAAASALSLGRRFTSKAFASVLASPPTITKTVTNTSSITSAVNYDADSPLFRYTAADYVYWNAIAGTYYYSQNVGGDQLVHVDFLCDAPVLEIKTVSFVTRLDIKVDGVRIQAADITTDASGSRTLVKINWGTARTMRRYEITGLNFSFGGVYTGPSDTVLRNAEVNDPLCYVLGDSYTQATGADQLFGTWAEVLGVRLGMRMYQDAKGGTGWSATGNDTPTTRLTRMMQVLGQTPDYVITALGYNDFAAANKFTTGVQQPYIDAIAKIKTLAPNATIITIGPWTPKGSADATEGTGLGQVRTILQTQAAALGATFIDVQDVLNAVNKAVYGQGDDVHQNGAGHVFLGDVVARKILGV